VIVALGVSSGAVLAQAPDAKLVAQGKQTFQAKICKNCHLAEGVGNKQFPLDGVGTKLKVEDIRAWIVTPADMIAKLETKPALPMPKLPLTEAEVDALVAYLSTLKTN